MSESGPQDAQPIDVPLLPGEQVLWRGTPDPRRVLGPADAVMIPFSIVWGGFAILWETMAFAMRAPWFMKLFGLPFVLFAVHLLVGRFVARWWRRRVTTYVLTTRRALDVRPRRTIAAPADNGPRTVQLSRDGRYLTVTFLTPSDAPPARAGRVWELQTESGAGGVVFEAVRDVAGLQAALNRSADGPQDRV